MRSSGFRRRLLLWIALAFVVLLVALQGLRGDSESDPTPSSTATPSETKPSRVRDVASTLTVPRAPFCESVDQATVEAALGGSIDEATTYDNGDPVEVGQLSDVSHEYGCRWDGGNAVTARAWVFVPPVTVKEARSMMEVARAPQECSTIPGTYGAPSVGLSCTGKARQQASYRGLFGDAWFTCTLTTPSSVRAERLARRADRWCAAIVLAAAR